MSDPKRLDVIRENPGLPLRAFPPAEAAAIVGMSTKSYIKYVRPFVKVVRRGDHVLTPLSELERWLDENAERVLEDVAA
jgi:hypothetical protein